MEQTIGRGTFLLVNVAAQRARQLMQGASPLIKTHSRKPAAIAIREVRAGLVPHYSPDVLLQDLSAEEPASEEGPGDSTE